MQRQLTFGGGVSPRNTRLRGQSIIEYVLIIAVIGLVIVFALIGNFIRTLPTFIRTCADECGNPIP